MGDRSDWSCRRQIHNSAQRINLRVPHTELGQQIIANEADPESVTVVVCRLGCSAGDLTSCIRESPQDVQQERRSGLFSSSGRPSATVKRCSTSNLRTRLASPKSSVNGRRIIDRSLGRHVQDINSRHHHASSLRLCIVIVDRIEEAPPRLTLILIYVSRSRTRGGHIRVVATRIGVMRAPGSESRRDKCQVCRRHRATRKHRPH